MKLMIRHTTDAEYEQCTDKLVEWTYSMLYCHWWMCSSTHVWHAEIVYWQKSVDSAGIRGDAVTYLIWVVDMLMNLCKLQQQHIDLFTLFFLSHNYADTLK